MEEHSARKQGFIKNANTWHSTYDINSKSTLVSVLTANDQLQKGKGQSQTWHKNIVKTKMTAPLSTNKNTILEIPTNNIEAARPHHQRHL